MALAIVAFMPAISSANATGTVDTGANAVSYYYQMTSNGWTFDLPTLWPVELTFRVYPTKGLTTEKVACWNERKMCYVFSDAMRAFKFDGDKFLLGQKLATGKDVVFRNLYKALQAQK